MFDDPNVSLPLLTSSDPGYSREGGLDPLGLYAVADSLAIRLVPGVRERMRDPRYLTAIAVGHVVCDGFEPDALAADGKSEPWQVYEWYVVEGLVRYHKDHEAVRGLPGVAKARDALAKGVSLSFSTYLKTAYVFGFHGIYRGLGQSLKLFDDSDFSNPAGSLLTRGKPIRDSTDFIPAKEMRRPGENPCMARYRTDSPTPARVVSQAGRAGISSENIWRHTESLNMSWQSCSKPCLETRTVLVGKYGGFCCLWKASPPGMQAMNLNAAFTKPSSYAPLQKCADCWTRSSPTNASRAWLKMPSTTACMR